MKLEETAIPGAYLITFDRHCDERGGFQRTWCAREFAEAGLTASLAQTSLSSNTKRGTLRGLHYQRAPAAEEKLVSCVRGRLFDVIVDMRGASPACGTWFGAELEADDGRALYIPKGVAHGFITLADDTWLLYQISEFFDPTLAAGIRWDDQDLGIDWLIEPVVISEGDQQLPQFASLNIK